MKKPAKVEVLPPKTKPGPPPKILDVERIAALRAQGIGWKRIAKRLRVAPATIFRQGVNRQFEPMPAGRPKKILDHRKLDSIVEVLPASPVEMLETLLIFDARALDMETRQELLRILPQLVHIRRAWKAEYMECGCISCHKKRPDYASGGFCARLSGPHLATNAESLPQPSSRDAIWLRNLRLSKMRSSSSTTQRSGYSTAKTNDGHVGILAFPLSTV